MNFILDQLAADPALAPAFRAAIKPQFFYASCGRCRQYLSQSDASLYDTGFRAFPDMPGTPMAQGGPAWDGYFDADEDRTARDEARRERFERENDWGDE